MKKLLVVVSMMLLAACSGGGGSSTTNVPAAQKTVIGTASEGAPLTGTAYLKDSKGTEATSPIDAVGGFKIVVDNMTPPYILKAGTLYSFASAPGTVNINPFTDLAVKNASNVVDMAPVYGGTASALAPQLQAIQSKIQTAVDDLNTKIDQVYQKYGLTTAAQKNFMTGGITIGQGVDAMFDTFKVAIAANGTITMKTKTGDAPIFTATRNSTTGVITVTFDPNANANMPVTLVGAPVFTTAMLSGKSFSVDGGTITFNANGTLSGVGINVAGETWNINSSGQLIMTGSSKGTRTCTIISGDATNGWTVNVTYSSSTPSETVTFVPTTTPTANIFTTAMLSGKSFSVDGGTITFNANGTLSGVGINVAGGSWNINSSGQLIMLGSSKGTRTCTIISGDATNGWTVNVTYSSSTPSETMIFVPTTTPTANVFTTAMISGKTYLITFSTGSSGIVTFNSNGTYADQSSNTGTWNINSSGQLITNVTLSGTVNTMTLTSSTASVITASNVAYNAKDSSKNSSFTVTFSTNTSTVIDPATNLMWQMADDNIKRNWNDAATYCNSATIAGYNDWRLPSKPELESLDKSSIYSQIIGTQMAQVNGIWIGSYWSSTSYDSTQAYHVFLTSGTGSGYASKTSYTNLVRCVRP